MANDQITPNAIISQFLDNQDPNRLRIAVDEMYKAAMRKASKDQVKTFTEAKNGIDDFIKGVQRWEAAWIAEKEQLVS